MVKRKVDNRIRVLIENGVSSGYRTLFVLVGNRSRDQVVYLHHMLSKTSLKQASVLWCYKKKLVFSSHRRKRVKQLKARQQYGLMDINEDDPFEMFVSMTDIRYCYYKETHKILGNTFKMCVLQDFEALTPNILCRTIETVEGGGVIVLLLESMTSLRQLYTLNMDVHSRYRTDGHQVVVPRFNERFILSLSSCPTCIVMNDEMQVLPISSLTRDIEPLPFSRGDTWVSTKEQELKALKESNKGVEPLGVLIGLCKTFDQAKVVSEFMSAITEKTLNATVTLTAARGRGKSAAMGLALAGAIAAGYSNMYVTSPSPENLNTLFEFVVKGLDALNYEKHLHYNTLCSTNAEYNKAVMRVTVTREQRQIIQYISPSECDLLDHAELVIIDEAAAIPLPQVQALFGSYLVFLASTISGYEGTGRSLSLKLIKQLREQIGNDSDDTQINKRKLVELNLNESIRYKEGDHVEKWLYDLLCLESTVVPFKGDLPSPNECSLFYVNRDTLFGYHKASEKFLKRIMNLLVTSHYRNTPDDLQILSDAPAHHLFVLLPPTNSTGVMPQVLCVIQVALEGKISKASLDSAMQSDHKPAGDLIPWTVSNVFEDDDFPRLSGARIVRIATHPDLQGKGYGSRALQLLNEYYNLSSSKASIDEVVPVHTQGVTVVQDEEVGLLDETIMPREQLHSLLLSPEEREPEALHYMGVSFGSSAPLLKFWKKAGYTCVYLSQVCNPLTGEHTCLLLKVLGEEKIARDESWLAPLWFDFGERMLNLLRVPFKKQDCKFALSLLTNKIYKRKAQAPPPYEMKLYLSKENLNDLDKFIRHQFDCSVISNIIPRLARLYFLNKIPGLKLKAVPSAILVGVGVQKKHPLTVAKELELDNSVLMSQMHMLISKFYEHLCPMMEVEVQNSEAIRNGSLLSEKTAMESEDGSADLLRRPKRKENEKSFENNRKKKLKF